MQLLKNREELLKHLNLEGKKCAEIGVFKGEFSQLILAQNPKTLYLIDPWEHQSIEIYPDDHANRVLHDFDTIYKELQSTLGKDERVKLIKGYSYFEAPKFEDNSLDFVYIDAIHTFESCYCDILSWYHKVKPEGWLCGHDYTGYFTGVKSAVTAFCRITKKEVNIMTIEDWGSWGLKK